MYTSNLGQKELWAFRVRGNWNHGCNCFAYEHLIIDNDGALKYNFVAFFLLHIAMSRQMTNIRDLSQ